jgi:hypothetical protein
MDTPGKDNTSKKADSPATGTPDQGRSAFSTGTTTQGGSNFGQGSSQLGGQVYKQGDALNAGSNYDNEAGRLANVSQPDSPTGDKHGGGAAGYDPGREQQEINKEREDMNNERDPKQVDVERPQNPEPDTHEPGKEPGNPGVH